MTAKGGNSIANITLSNDIDNFFMFANIVIFIVEIHGIFNVGLCQKKQKIIIVLFNKNH